MRKIVVGFDGTDRAKDALQLSGSLVAAFDAQLIVASAVQIRPLEIDASTSEEIGLEYHAKVFEQARAELGSANFERRQLEDGAARGLMALAEDEQADLIVIGSTHHGPIGRVLAGSVAAQLFQGAPCAVLVAPHGRADHEHAGFGLIGVAYDGSDEAKVALASAENLARALGARLRLITVAPYIGSDPHSGPLELTRKTWADRLSQGAGSVSDDVETEQVLRQGREAAELALQGVELDLLVVGSRGHGPLRRTLVGSVASELVRTAPCPVLVVPRGAEAPVEVGTTSQPTAG